MYLRTRILVINLRHLKERQYHIQLTQDLNKTKFLVKLLNQLLIKSNH